MQIKKSFCCLTIFISKNIVVNKINAYLYTIFCKFAANLKNKNKNICHFYWKKLFLKD